MADDVEYPPTAAAKIADRIRNSADDSPVDYPPSAASMIAERIRNSSDEPHQRSSGYPAGVLLPLASHGCGSSEVPPRPPTATMTVLPIAGRGQRQPQTPPAMLPIQGRGHAAASHSPLNQQTPAMLPIAGRGQAGPSSGISREATTPTLPIGTRGGDGANHSSAKPTDLAVLPIAARADVQPEGTAGREHALEKAVLPIGIRGEGQTATLPINGQGADQKAILPIGGRGQVMLPLGGHSVAHLNGGGDGARQLKANFVTDTITTPLASAAFPGSGFGSNIGFKKSPVLPFASPGLSFAVPLPISSTISNASTSSLEMPFGASSSLPRWARSWSERERQFASGAGSPLTQTSQGEAPFPSSAISSGMSNTSFRWSGPDAFVQSWHRKLTETYQDYKMMNILGEGRSGAVFIVQNKFTDKFFACKGLSKAEHDTKDLVGEIENMKRLDHPNIVRLFETLEDRETVFLLMELCQGGDLFSRIQDSQHCRLSESNARAFALQMLSALAYCHSLGIVHRDVKPENFLLETDDPHCLSLKLADFGIATRIRPVTNMSSRLASADWGVSGVGSGWSSFVNNEAQMGSLPYMAPELFTSEGKAKLKAAEGRERLQIMAASDLWACGVVIYVMLSGLLPFGEDPRMICSGFPPDFSHDLWKTISEEAKDLILNLVRSSIGQRLTARQALAHEWFRGCSPVNGYGPEGCNLLQNSEDSRYNVASMLLKSLRTWKQAPKLRRIVITAIAKHLEGQEHKKMAMMVHRVFNDGSEHLKCDQLVRALNDALSEALDPASAQDSQGSSQPAQSMPESMVKGSLPAGSSRWTRTEQGHTFTGLHVRSRVKQAFSKRLTRLSEDTPTPGSPVTFAHDFQNADSGNPTSLNELRSLINTLDASKNGIVDYTCLVAALLPEEVYCDDSRILEVFRVFDFQHRGKISPDDVWKVVRGKGKHEDPAALASLANAVKEYDLNGDGMLSLAEFAAMVRSASKASTSMNGRG